MKPHLTILILAVLLCVSVLIHGQEIRQSDMTDIAEELAGDESDPESAAIFLERLQELAENPVMINSAEENELARLFFLTDFQIRALSDHIRSTGSILSLYEIASIPGFDRRTAEIMNPLISLRESGRKININSKFMSRTLSSFIIKPAGSDSNYPGSAWKILVRHRTEKGPFTAGFTCEKDPGEKFLSGSPPLPDFLSAHLAFSGNGLVRKVIAGDYSAKFGQGTALNTGIHTGLPLTAAGYFPSRNEIKPYTSVDENNFFRGAACELASGMAGLSLFFSHNRIDAATEYSGDSSELYIRSLYKTGLHNTPSAILKKDAAAETAYGTNLSLNFRKVTAGMNFHRTILSLPFTDSLAKAEKLFDFTGRRKDILSAYYTASIGRSLLFGELSYGGSNRSALVQGFTLRASGRLTINGLYRYYSPGFGGLHSRGPGTGSSAANEEGILGNFTFEAARYLFISAGYDLCRHPWLKYRTSFPSLSKRYEVKLRYLPPDRLNVEMSYCNRSSVNNEKKDRGIAGRKTASSGTLRTVFRYSPEKNLSLNFRIDCKSVRESGSRGYLMSQDLKYSFRTLPLTFWTRFCLFSTDDWDSRLYVYEHDLLYSYSIPAFSREGSRMYLMTEWNFSSFARIRLKYAHTSFHDNNPPEDLNELRMQLIMRF
ncbi:MAG TPA: hypothetical protein PLZ75_06290 [Bacteroidales bacterium]|jgi:hypothetical protein|nr:hypothetical protein [Bacteroidales bacterium]HQH24317.1 hypothetical protein [Bacteroidales bacterium]HQJ81552.1 hypothetical protein [Bacteroidales bacterium]